MSETRSENSGSITVYAALAAVAALIGFADAAYLTVHHYTAVPVPCNVISGCETVLTSSYAEIAGVPLAAIGGAAYFAAFALAVLAAFGDRRMWMVFGIHVSLMMAVTLWLLYLQAFIINAFCQFCLISAAVTTTMFVIYIVSRIVRRKKV